MAKIQYSALINSIEGKLAGTIFTHGPYGSYLKRATNPCKPQTIKQSLIKCAFQDAAKTWRSQTPAQRLLWNVAAKSTVVRSILGTSISVSGFTLFMSGCGQAHMAGVPFPTAPLPQALLYRVTSGSMAWGGSPANMILTFAPIIPINCILLLYMTAPCSAGINTPNKRWRFIKKFVYGNTSPQNVRAEYEAVFGSVPAPTHQTGWAIVGLPRVPRVGTKGVIGNSDLSGTLITP
jgi:hypothetical protein